MTAHGLILGSWFCLKCLVQVLVLACLYPSNICFTPSECQEIWRVHKIWFTAFRSSKISKFLGGGADKKGHFGLHWARQSHEGLCIQKRPHC